MIHELRAALLGISSYRALMEEPLMGSVRRLLDALVKNRGEEALEAYTDVFYRLRREGNMGLGEWIWDKLRYLESPYPTALGTGVCDPALESAARRDIETLALLAGLDCDRLISSMAKRLAEEFAPVLRDCPGGGRERPSPSNPSPSFTGCMGRDASPVTGPSSGRTGH